MLNGALLAWEYHEVYFDMCGIEKRLQRQPHPPLDPDPPAQILCAATEHLFVPCNRTKKAAASVLLTGLLHGYS